jgi:uncharacterized protein
MRILIDIQHPANYLLFKNFAAILMKKGHKVLFTIREKEVTKQLIQHNGLEYISFGTNLRTIIGKLFGLLKFSFNLLETVQKFKPTLFISHGSIYSAIVSKIVMVPNISLNAVDSDDFLKLTGPLTTYYLTPESFTRDLGPKQITYPGYHEISYLSPKYFSPDSSIFESLGIKRNEKYVIIRFVSWDAYDDLGMSGMSDTQKYQLVKELSSHCRVFVSSEGRLPDNISQYSLDIEPWELQSAEYFADLLIGESGSMSAESAMMGTPSIYISSKSHGFITDIGRRYGLIYHTENFKEALNRAEEILNYDAAQEYYKAQSNRLMAENINLTEYLCWFVENIHHGSVIKSPRKEMFLNV